MPQPREQDLVFVVDEDCGPRVSDAIVACGGKAVLVEHVFGAGTPDHVWIPGAAAHGHAIVTKDVAMRTNKAARSALEICGVHVFVLRAAELKFEELQANVTMHYKAMVKYVLKYAPPFSASVTKTDIVVLKKGERRAGVKRS